jgi:hypothetical protein
LQIRFCRWPHINVVRFRWPGFLPTRFRQLREFPQEIQPNPGESIPIKPKRGAFCYGVFTPFTERRNCTMLILDRRIAVERQGLKERPAEPGTKA